MDVRIKRVYEPAESADGCRVLVDRLWPRGVSKTRADLDAWEKDAAPSAELRKDWHSDPDQFTDASFAAFSDSYRGELHEPPAAQAVEELCKLARKNDRLTLVYGAKNAEYNHAKVLRDVLLEALRGEGPTGRKTVRRAARSPQSH